jgi:hypothetical protein
VEQPKKFEFIIKSESSQADRPDDSAERAGAGGQGHKIDRELRAGSQQNTHEETII